jgi:hypothetical protein
MGFYSYLNPTRQGEGLMQKHRGMGFPALPIRDQGDDP